LRHVLVAGGNGHVDAGRRRLYRKRAQHVVGFHAFDAQDRKSQRGDDLAHRLHLGAEFVRHRRAVGLVVGIQFVAEGLARRIHHERSELGFLLQVRAQHVDHAEQRAGGLAGRVAQRWQRMEGAIEIKRSVDQD
jgi:hypothetical protein